MSWKLDNIPPDQYADIERMRGTGDLQGIAMLFDRFGVIPHDECLSCGLRRFWEWVDYYLRNYKPSTDE